VVSLDRAAIYCRLSKEDQDKYKEGDDSASIHNQKMMLVDFALEHEFIVHDIYSDDDFKGFDQDRPEFNRMITDAKLKKYNTIICKTQSRFTRDMEMVEKYIHGMFVLLGIRFIGVVDHVDTNIKGNKKARQINGLINEWYSEDLSENIRTVFRSKMEKGEFLGAFACYGYKKDPKDNHKLMIDEPAAAVVRKIYAYSLQGFGNKQICIKLQEEGIPTPCRYKQSEDMNYRHPKTDNFGYRYGIWGPNTIRRILTNRMYIGEMVQGRERKVSYKSKKVIEVPKEEWIIVPNTHEPIVEKEVFDIVQNLVKSRRYARSIDEKGSKNIALLAGKVRCLDCGNLLTRINGSTKYVYLYCSLYKRSGKAQCTPHSIRSIKLEELLKERIQSIIDNHLDHHQIDELWMEDDTNNKQLVKKQAQLLKLSEKINKIKKALTMIYIDKSNDVISESEYQELKSSLDKERDENATQYRLLNREIDTLTEESNYGERAEGLVSKYTDFDVLNHEIINEFVEYIEVGEKDQKGNQEVLIHWRF
jgi:DNA invertase Pin-like site-specific DNA recombinase